MDMDVSRRKESLRSGVIAGSVWESRMKVDEVKGGIKVFNDDTNSEEIGEISNVVTTTKVRSKQGVIGVSRRRNWKSESSVEGSEKNPVQISRRKSEVKIPIQTKKRSEMVVPIQKMKTRSEEPIIPIPIRKSKSELGEGTEKNSIPPRRVKSECIKGLDEFSDEIHDQKIDVVEDDLGDGIEKNPIELEEERLGLGIQKNPVEIKDSGSDETCEKLDLSQEIVISTSLSNVGQIKSAPLKVDDDDDEEELDEELEEELDEEIEDVEIEKCLDAEKIEIPEKIPKQIVKEVKKMHKIQENPLPITPFVKKQPPNYINKSKLHPIPTKAVPTPISSEFQRMPETHSKLQSLVDLVMWKDASKSAFVFGTGTFIIISSSYTRDLNISLISVISYLSLVYLALTFLYRSIIYRGHIDIDDKDVVGEEEIVWIMKIVLPYLNEFLFKLRALFSGDPATTMKLAVLLFVLARCGTSITIWKMAKLGFFGAFILPKVCSSYSTQLTGYGKFWVRRFADAWDTCSHKKAVAFGIFTLVWNLSSVVARIWALFMLYVAFRYYQQSFVGENWVDPQPRDEDTWQGNIGGGRRQRRGPTSLAMKKPKKAF